MTEQDNLSTGSTNRELLDSNIDYKIELREQQSLPIGFAAGFAAAIVGGILWAAVSYLTGFQIGYMAIAIGIMVGFAIRIFGKGIDPTFAYMGAGLSFFGCALGNLLTVVVVVAKEAAIPLMDAMPLLANFSFIKTAFVETFGVMDILFYGLAIYEGFKFSRISEDSI